MSLYTAYLEDVMPYVPTCPEAVATDAIRRAVIEFCRKSHWLVYTHDPILTVAGVGSYTLNLPADTELATIREASCENLPLTPAGDAEASVVVIPAAGSPRYITQIDTFNVRLVPTPQIGGLTIRMLLAITPTRSSLTCDDTLTERWSERIGYGARSRLYDIPGQPFSSPDMAVRYRQMFISAIGEAKIERNKGLTRESTRVSFPRFI